MGSFVLSGMCLISLHTKMIILFLFFFISFSLRHYLSQVVLVWKYTLNLLSRREVSAGHFWTFFSCFSCVCVCLRADVSAQEQPELFLKKLQQCCAVFDFMDTLSDLKMKEYKRSTLNELVDYVTVSRGYLTEQAYPEVVKMVSEKVTWTCIIYLWTGFIHLPKWYNLTWDFNNQ